MIGETEKTAIKKFCAQGTEGLLLAYGIIRGSDYCKINVAGKPTIPFWSKREDAEMYLRANSEISDGDIVDLDVIFLVATQFQEFENRGQFIGINWSADQTEWWSQPVSEVENMIREELNWKK